MVGDWVAVGFKEEIKLFYFDSKFGLEREVKLIEGPTTLKTKLFKRGLFDLTVSSEDQALVAYPYHTCDYFLRFALFDGEKQSQIENHLKHKAVCN